MLHERLYTALHLPNFGSRADGEQDNSTPDGRDCTAYFERDWQDVSDDAVNGGRWFRECTSSLIGVLAFNDDGTATAYTKDEATDAFGIVWVRAMEADDAEAAENE